MEAIRIKIYSITYFLKFALRNYCWVDNLDVFALKQRELGQEAVTSVRACGCRGGWHLVERRREQVDLHHQQRDNGRGNRRVAARVVCTAIIASQLCNQQMQLFTLGRNMLKVSSARLRPAQWGRGLEQFAWPSLRQRLFSNLTSVT